MSAVTHTTHELHSAPKASSEKPSGAPSSEVQRRRIPGWVQSSLILIASLVLVIAIWELASRLFAIPFLFPGPLAVLDALLLAVDNGTLIESVAASLIRIAAGFLIGSIAGVLLGLLLGASKIANGMAAPLITFFRFVPPLAWFAPVLVWFGAGETSKIVLIIYTSVFVVALNTMEGRSKVPKDLHRMAGVAGVNWWQRMLWVTLPASVPYIFAGARVAMGNAFMTVVAAEMLGASEGLGVMINNGMITSNIPNVFAAILVLGTLGLITDRLFVFCLNKFGRRFSGNRSIDVA